MLRPGEYADVLRAIGWTLDRRLAEGEAAHVELVVLRDANEVGAAVAEQLRRAASAGGHIALTGGTTPERAYTEAAEREPLCLTQLPTPHLALLLASSPDSSPLPPRRQRGHGAGDRLAAGK